MEPIERIARAVEELAKGLDRLNRNLERARPTPDLQVARVGKQSGLAAVNLAEDGRKLWVHLLNAGSATTTVDSAEIQFNEQSLSGGILGPDSRILRRMTVRPDEGAILAFTLDVQLINVDLTLRVGHSPGVFPDGTMLVAKLERIGMMEGRPSWQPVELHNEPWRSHATG
jgi:hypothetical protein